jgi:hypothetical protein
MKPRRRRREAYLPRITEMALAGLSTPVISAEIRVPYSTVWKWLKELRQEWIAESQTNVAELIGIAYARYESIYRKAMQGWHDSQQAMEEETAENRGPEDKAGGARKKTRRPAPRASDAAFLAKALDAVKAICELRGLNAPRRTEVAGPGGRPIELTAVTPDDLRCLTDEQLAALEARLLARDQPEAASLLLEASPGPHPACLDGEPG